MTKQPTFLLRASFAALLLVLPGCSNKKAETLEQKQSPASVESEQKEQATQPYEVTESKAALEDYYKVEHIREWYPERVLPPPFDFEMDISTKSDIELWLLRNEIFARNGYLFDDAVLRGYFNMFNWYQPIFYIREFKVQLNAKEEAFVNKVKKREQELVQTRYVDLKGNALVHTDHIYNKMQFKAVPTALLDALATANFAIVPTDEQQLFYAYDNNHYQYIPNFITTDLYLQVMHKHFSSLLRDIEESKFSSSIKTILNGSYSESRAFEMRVKDDPKMLDAARWASTYLAIARSLISGNSSEVPEGMGRAYEDEMEKVLNGDGFGSEFLEDSLLQYSQFRPRGNYNDSDEMRQYFRCVTWLGLAAIHRNNDRQLMAAIIMAHSIRSNSMQLQAFNVFHEGVGFIVGDEDNVSMNDLMKWLNSNGPGDPSTLKNALPDARQYLDARPQGKINPKAATAALDVAIAAPTLLFFAGRYTFDAEILSKLVHVLKPVPKRPFPKGLDVFAALGVKEAETILLDEFQEGKNWEEYPVTLQHLKSRFQTFDGWDNNLYNKTMQVIRSLHADNAKFPGFMKTSAWSRKNLSTSLASWTELKHDVLLYSERPYAAQAGEGGGPPPPSHISYVEPNVEFWKNAISFIDLQQQTLGRLGLLTTHTQEVNKELRELASLLLLVSEKELAGKLISNDEFEELSWIGGRVESITFRIHKSYDHLPEKERMIALVADVYQVNNEYLEEAVGNADDIYVIAEINGKPYLTRGSIFSYYEFNSDGGPMTDDSWQAKVNAMQTPPRPSWIHHMVVNIRSLESKPQYAF